MLEKMKLIGHKDKCEIKCEPICNSKCNNKWFVLASYNSAPISGDNIIYMEVDNFNSADEIFPNNTNSNASYNNTYNGIVKSAFAKIAVGKEATSFSTKASIGYYITHMKNQLVERIDKLKVKFRYHDGRYVYFNSDINFSILFNCAVENPMSNINITDVILIVDTIIQ